MKRRDAAIGNSAWPSAATGRRLLNRGRMLKGAKGLLLQSVAAVSLIAVLAAMAGCAPTIFTKDPDCGTGCTRLVGSMLKHVEYNVTVTGKKVDILIVTDNSGSMSFEHSRMAERFQNFLSQIEAKNLSYRIGITTSDVSSAGNPPRAINLNGALQDGRLIPFPNGVSYLENSTPNKLQLFQQAVQRAETLNCENFLRTGNRNDTAGYLASCPSNDERGILAANMFVDGNHGGFLREGSHFAVVFLTDEDVRSGVYTQAAGYPLELRDLPVSLMNNIQSRFPGKPFSFHAIIVRPGPLYSGVSAAAASNFLTEAAAFGNIQWPQEAQPGLLFNESNKDYGCLSQQGNQTPGVSGSFGFVYAVAAALTNGVVGDVCASDYGAQLSSIGDNISQQITQINMACENPRVIELKFLNKPGIPLGTFSGSTFTLDPSVGTGDQVYLKIECPDV